MYIGRYMYPDYLYMYEVVLVHVGGTKGKVGNVFPRVYVCDGCRQSIPKVPYVPSKCSQQALTAEGGCI